MVYSTILLYLISLKNIVSLTFEILPVDFFTYAFAKGQKHCVKRLSLILSPYATLFQFLHLFCFFHFSNDRFQLDWREMSSRWNPGQLALSVARHWSVLSWPNVKLTQPKMGESGQTGCISSSTFSPRSPTLQRSFLLSPEKVKGNQKETIFDISLPVAWGCQ